MGLYVKLYPLFVYEINFMISLDHTSGNKYKCFKHVVQTI